MIHQSKKIILIALVLANLLVTIPVSNAASVSCKQLNTPEQVKDWIITILEEQISAPNAQDVTTPDNQTETFECLRVTKDCGDKVKCSEYQDVEGATCPDGQFCQRVQVIISKTGTGLMYFYIGLIYRWAAATIGIVSVLYLIIGGLQMTMARDNASNYESAKTRIMQSIAGLVILFLSGIILYTINPNFFTQ